MQDQEPTPTKDTPTTDTERRIEQERERMSGPDRAVDHDRAPGVPPPSNDDYDDMLDIEGAESFPASDPPSGW